MIACACAAQEWAKVAEPIAWAIGLPASIAAFGWACHKLGVTL